MKKLKTIILILILSLNYSCISFKKTDARSVPTSGPERARKNLEEGRGVSIKSATEALKGGGNFEFSTSNPLWRATIEILDFLPLANVDYSGGLITTDWYSEQNAKESIKITVRFLSNEISSTSVKVIVHQKICENINSCTIKLLNSKIRDDLTKSILTKAAELEVKNKKKK